ncbi:alpha/beta hydrolase [uncultured Ruegeria sp.]|uniref:alpha/beta fold hydrolase n=1 Tax=uncultured Ruegeria sp. TaxID=259304 RepID=UPI00260C651D|nr:alpha/beta hydrolase [uncultured Ruegeria sp.]
MTWSELKSVNVDGMVLECATWGPSPTEAPTLVLLHEGLGCVELWRDFPAQIAADTGLGVLAFSRAGYGQSDPATLPRQLDYMTREANTVLPQVLDEAGIGRCILVGHSDGATIAAIYAGSAVDARVRGLVLMAPHFFTEGMGLMAIAKAKDAFDTGDLATRMAPYHQDPEATFRGWNDAWLAPIFKDWDVSEVIDYLRVPSLVIQGHDDQYGTSAQIDELATRSYAPVEVAMLENCRHSPHLDQAEKTRHLIADFVSRLERIERSEVRVA